MAINSTWFGKSSALQSNYNQSDSLLIVGLTFLPLFISLYAEFIADIIPCQLCIYQRLPYIVILPLLFLRRLSAKYLFFIIKILLAINFILTFIHLGIIHEWFHLNIGCTNNLQQSKSFADFKNMIIQNQEIPCNQNNWQVFGVSITLWHLFYIIFYFIVITLISFKYVKNR